VKFSGELKFPEIDHPGVPIQIVIDDVQLEILIEGESLGRWSLYDVHARRLVASAFQIDLDGTEVTFVADDPIDFAYRGVEHMAETWATLKSKRMANRTIAVRKSRRDAIPSRIDDMKAAMETNLDEQTTPRQIAGEHAMPEPALLDRAAAAGDLSQDVDAGDWDIGDEATVMPVVDDGTGAVTPEDIAKLSEEARLLEEEKQHLAEERASFDEERRRAELQEANRIEAYRLEMHRLETEREELRRRASELAERAEEELAAEAAPETMAVRETNLEPVPDLEPDPEPEPVAADVETVPVVAEETVPVVAEETVPVAVEETVPVAEEPDIEPEPEVEPEPVADEEPEPEPSGAGVLDLKDFEETQTEAGDDQVEVPSTPPVSGRRKQPEPALAGVSKDRGGLMGAVKAAFRSGPKHHEHQFIEAPGGMGITRYVCEECGYVSISV
jgi:hypothetical protein